MSGFVAVVSLSGDPVRPWQEASALADHYRALRGERAAATEVGKGAAASAVAFDGVATDDELGWTLLHGSAHGAAPHPLPPSALAGLDGQFATVSWDDSTRVLLAATDGFATSPVYVCRRGDLVYVSTSALVLARHLKPRASARGLRHFLVTGNQFGPLTHWEDVRRLEPGSCVVVADGTVTDRFYWAPQPDPALEALDLRAASDLLTETMVGALADRFRDRPTWLDLTGGYDSRLLALLAARAGVDFRANTREASAYPDVRMASDIAERRGWDWHEIRTPWDWPERLPHLLDDALAAADGRLEVLQLSRVAWGHRELASRVPRLLSAGGGEQLQDRMFLSAYPRPDRPHPDLGRWADIVVLRPMDLDVLAPGSYEAGRESFLDLVGRAAQRYGGEPASRQLDYCFAYKASGHFGAYRAADDMELAAQLPFYWRSTYDVSFALSRRHKTGHRLMRLMMHRLDPEIARMPTTRGGPAAPMTPANFHRYLPFYGQMARKTVTKSAQLLTGRTPFAPRAEFGWPAEKSNESVVRHLQESGVLDLGDLRIASLLAPGGAQRIGTRQMSARMLGRLITAELALARSGTEL
jgi:hypothetical protein